MRGRDLAVEYAILFDKRQILRRRPTNINAGETLEALAEGLTVWHRAHKERLIGEGSTSTPRDDEVS